MTLLDYIIANFSRNQPEFARHTGVSRQKVNGLIFEGWVIVNHTLYIPRRAFPGRGATDA